MDTLLFIIKRRFAMNQTQLYLLGKPLLDALLLGVYPSYLAMLSSFLASYLFPSKLNRELVLILQAQWVLLLVVVKKCLSSALQGDQISVFLVTLCIFHFTEYFFLVLY